MISRPVFYGISVFRNQYYNGLRNMGKPFSEKSHNSWKECKWLYTSSTNYKLQKKVKQKLEVELVTKNRLLKPLEVWEEMTVEDFIKVFNCDLGVIQILIPNLKKNHKLEKKEIWFLARNLRKKCILIKNPDKVDSKNKINDDEYIIQSPSRPENLIKRPPVVTVMGHIDHGKTTLLDSLRHTFVVDKEFGGITQHIGAFTVAVNSGEKITFIDTPGHAAFTTMRARGAEVTDIVVLVIAADDGIKEQTVESIKIAKRACVKMIIAVNKIDKPKALSIDVIKEKLLFEGIQVEDKGGDVQIIPISALKKINLDLLTEVILLEAELMNLRGDPTGLVEGVIIESKMDKQGPLATIIVKRGTLKKGKLLIGGTSYARVRCMLDENSKEYTEALPSTPVQVLGWKKLPNAGDEVFEVTSEKQASKIIRLRRKKEMMKKQEEDLEIINEKAELHQQKFHEDRFYYKSLKSWQERKKYFQELAESRRKKKETINKPILNIILKGDVHGTLEVLLEILSSYDKNDECEMSIVDASVGNITQTDLELSETFNAIIYAFNVDLHESIKESVKSKRVDIRNHNIIYKLLDDLKSELSLQIPHKDVEKIIGEADVNQVFSISKGRKKLPVAGCKCIKGDLLKNAAFKVMRGDQVIFDGKLVSMRHHKNEIDEVHRDQECGLMFDSFNGELQPLDKVICYKIEQVPQSTSWDPGF